DMLLYRTGRWTVGGAGAPPIEQNEPAEPGQTPEERGRAWLLPEHVDSRVDVARLEYEGVGTLTHDLVGKMNSPAFCVFDRGGLHRRQSCRKTFRSIQVGALENGHRPRRQLCTSA